MDLERLRDERVVSFLLRVMADPGESSELRIHVLKRLRSRRLTADERSAVAGALGELMLPDGSIDLRLQAALTLGEFTDVTGVVTHSDSWPWRPRSYSISGIPPSPPWSARDPRRSASICCASCRTTRSSVARREAPWRVGASNNWIDSWTKRHRSE